MALSYLFVYVDAKSAIPPLAKIDEVKYEMLQFWSDVTLITTRLITPERIISIVLW